MASNRLSSGLLKVHNIECHNDELSIFGEQNHLTLEIEPCDFLIIFFISTTFCYKLFLIKRGVYHLCVWSGREITPPRSSINVVTWKACRFSFHGSHDPEDETSFSASDLTIHSTFLPNCQAKCCID